MRIETHVAKKKIHTFIPNTMKLHTFHYDHWFDELSKIEYAFFNHCITLLQNDVEQLFELLANRKKLQAVIKKLEVTTTSKSMKAMPKERVHTFLKQLPIDQLAHQLQQLSKILPYKVENHVAVLYFGQQQGDDLIPFTVDDLIEGRILLHHEKDSYSFSLLALVYFALANELVHQADEARIINCKSEVAEATYAVSYSKALLQEHLNYFFIQPDDNCVTSYLLTSIMFTKTKRFVEDALLLDAVIEGDYVDTLQQSLKELEMKHIAILNTAYIQSVNKSVKHSDKKLQQLTQKLNDMEQRYDKLKIKYDQELASKKDLKNELQQLKYNATSTAVIDDSRLQLLEELKTQTKELKETKKDLEKVNRQLIKDYDGKLEKLNADNRRLISENSLLQQQLIIEKRSKVQQAELSFEEWLDKGRGYLTTMTTTQEQLLENFLAIAHDIIEQQKTNRPKHSLTTNKVGYCVVKDNSHYVRLANGDLVKITNIPPAIYPSNNQFVEVTKDNEFVQLLDDFHYESTANYTIAHYAIVVERNGQPFIKIDGKLQSVKFKDNVKILDGQVISVNHQFELVYYYQPREVNLDDIYPSVLIKGHEPYYVELSLENGYVLRDLKDNRKFVQLEEVIADRSFIIMDGDGVTFYDATGNMLKKSSHYRYRQVASVSSIEDKIYVLKQNEEYVLLQQVPFNIELELGDMVAVDEHNHFIEKLNYELDYVETETLEQKLLNATRFKVTKQKESVIKDRRLLIIGNVRLSERYKMYFGQLGFDVDVVDGTGPFEKIRQACSKHELIVYCTAFTKHMHSDRMVVEFKKQYIMCDSTSPQVIKQALMKHL